MGKVTSTPLLFQSKLVCFSLLYLFTSLFLALYTSLSQTKCLFRSSPFDPIQTPLFSYPPNYREHQYAIPTQRKSCSSRIYFSGTLHFFFSEAQYWNLVILSLDFGKWVLVFVLRLLEGLEGDPKFVQFCVGITGFEVYAEKVRDFWRKFQYPKSDFVFCSLQ